MHDVQAELPERHVLAIVQRPEGIFHTGRLVQAQLSAVFCRQSPCSGDVVGVDVSVDHVAKSELPLAQQVIILLNLGRRIDDCGFM